MEQLEGYIDANGIVDVEGLLDVTDTLSPYLVKLLRSYKEEVAYCERCNGASCPKTGGFTPYATPQVQAGNYGVFIAYGNCKVKRRQIRQQFLDNAFKSSQIPDRYRGKTFENYKVTEGNVNAVKCAKWVLDNPDSGLFLTGHCGCGKTMLAAIVANETLKRGKSVLFATVPQLLSSIKATFDSEQSTAAVMKSIETVDLLVLDDLGTEKVSDWVAETLFSIINARYNDSKQTIITSNCDAKTIEHCLNLPDKLGKETIETGTRIISRVRAMCKHVRITDKDWRMQ